LNFLPDPLELLNDVEFNPFSPLKESNRAFDTFPQQLAPSFLDEQFSTNFAPSTEIFGAGTSAEQYPVTASAGEHSTVPLHEEASVVVLTAGANIQPGQTTLPPQALITSTRPEQPPQNSNSEMICDHLDCRDKNLIFANFRDWS
jgi:hypothetical protein